MDAEGQASVDEMAAMAARVGRAPSMSMQALLMAMFHWLPQVAQNISRVTTDVNPKVPMHCLAFFTEFVVFTIRRVCKDFREVIDVCYLHRPFPKALGR